MKSGMDELDSTDCMNSSIESNSSESSDNFDDISQYFLPKNFAELSKLEKTAYRRQKDRYEDIIKSTSGDFPNLQPPQFMKDYAERELSIRKRKAEYDSKQKSLQTKRNRNNKKCTTSATRKSSRLQQESNKSNNENSENEPPEGEQEPFQGIKPFFTSSEWDKLNVVTKRYFQIAMDEYNEALREGRPVEIPKFMVRKDKETCSNALSTICAAERTQGIDAGTPWRDVFSLPATTSTAPKDFNNTKNQRVGQEPLRPACKTGVQSKQAVQSGGKASTSNISFSVELSDQSQSGDDTQENNFSSESDIRSIIRNIVSSALPKLKPEVLSKLEDHLIALGVEVEADLSLVKEQWLESLDLNPIQLSKIMSALDEHCKSSQEGGKGNKTNKATRRKKSDTELMHNESSEKSSSVAIVSRPTLSQSKLCVPTLGGFIVDFSKFRDTFLRSLEMGERPSPGDRENFIFVLSMDIRDKYEEIKIHNPSLKQKTPGRSVYKTIVQSIFRFQKGKYVSCLQDMLKGKVIGDGMFSLVDSIETCIENKSRPKKPAGERAARVKGIRAAACILEDKYAPPLNKHQRTEGEQIRKSLLAIYKSPKAEWDWVEIKKMIVEYSSLASQRAMITARNRRMDELVDQWPFLFELNGLLCHLNEITQSDLCDNFEKFIDCELDDWIQYLTVMSPSRIKLLKLQNEVALGDGVHRRFLSLIYMLAIHWDEDPGVLFSSVEETTMSYEVVDILGNNLPETPHVVSLGMSKSLDFFFSVHQLLRQKDFTSSWTLYAFVIISQPVWRQYSHCVQAAYFVFGVLYPPKAKNTLLFVERFMANLTDDSGLLKASTSKGGPAQSAVTKLKMLEDDMASFKKQMSD
ncbi:Ribosomal protein L11 methyltransferase [Frankliniella fusca]|uniref:Ribosomal protein L11 methyltransferase n=1 Tax=Frankliniella fusca TaxID=407009 RepID=A0AAE1HA01_9NEOP|nr:Ribosomal protein L11 methyltransferase [Frankliniella fusca]